MKRRKTDGGGGVEGGKGKKKHLCGCVCVRACANVSMHFGVCEGVSSVRVIAQSQEASGGHTQFQLAAPS